jgi:hypothetical protein
MMRGLMMGLVELTSLVLTALAVILVVLPLCGAFADAVAFARFPAHRVTPADPWVLFDQRFRGRVWRWVVVWILAVPVTGMVVTLVMSEGGWTRGAPYKVGVQCAAFTLSAMLVAVAVIFAVAPMQPRIAFTIPAGLILTAVLFSGIIIVGQLPPPSNISFPRDTPWGGVPIVGVEYVYTSLALSLTTAAAIVFFYGFRRRIPLFREESEGLREGPEAK